jgi:outer membrane protein assembly complex protein YaeT
VRAIDVGALEAVLATRQSSRLPWGTTRYFDRARFEQDLKRISTFYADRGYPDAHVTGFDVQFNRPHDAVDVTVTIAEGEPVLVDQLDFTGFDVLPAHRFAVLKRTVPLKPGRPRDRQQVLTTSQMALGELRDHGYPYATVAVNETHGPDGRHVLVTFVAAPGKQARFGPIEVQGTKTVSDSIVRRTVTFTPGDTYQRSRIQDTERRLYGLELFQFANVEPMGLGDQPTEIPTRITVVEGKHQRVNFGVGYGAEEGGRVDGEYHHVNFLGGARTAGVRARWSSLDRGVQLDFKQPNVFDPHISLGLQARQWYSLTPAYESTVLGASVVATYTVSARTSFALSFISQRESSGIASDVLSDLTLRNNLIALGLDPRTGEQSGTLNVLLFDVQRGTAGNVLDARRGYQVAAHVEQAGRLMRGSFRYTSISVDGRHYLPLGDHAVLASRLQLASIVPAADDPGSIPFSKKLFLGGATSIRGWGRYEVSPLSDSGLPIGGNSLLAFSSELRVPLRGRLDGVTFLDGGNVWADAAGVQLADLRYAAGGGLRYQTPVGPVRLDVGYQLNPIPGLLVNGEPQARRWRVHFSVGQAF